MTRRQPLEVWLYGTKVATLTEPRPFRYRLSFTDEALERYGSARVLSLAIPFSRRPLVDSVPNGLQVSAFLEGVLPEGNLRSQLASALKVPTSDKMALLRSVGAECAGAVQFLAPGQAPSRGTVLPLSSSEVDHVVAALPTYQSPDGSFPQASLAGIQDKVLLTKVGDGWGWPTEGAASTHIVKPEPLPGRGAVAGLIEAEHWALAVARAAGIPAAASSLHVFGGRRAIVVERYDRTSGGSRRHQEDFCQALGLDPMAKYESESEYLAQGSRLRRLATLAANRALSPTEFRERLLEAVTFNAVIGNGDAHSKNYSVLIDERGEVSLAPLYDTAPVMHLNPIFQSLGHLINGRTSLLRITHEDLVAEGASWGLPASRAASAVTDTMERTWGAIHAIEPPPECGPLLENLERAWHSRSWPSAPRRTERPADPSPAVAGGVWVPQHIRAGAVVRGYWRQR